MQHYVLIFSIKVAGDVISETTNKDRLNSVWSPERC